MSEHRVIHCLRWSFSSLIAALAVACGGDSSPPPMQNTGGLTGVGGGTGDTGGTSGTGGGGAGSGGTSGGTTVTLMGVCNPDTGGECVLPTAPIDCGGAMLQKPLLVNFSTLASSGNWGAAAAGDLTGGTSLYHGLCDSILTVRRESDSEVIDVTGTIPVGDYAGVVLWFGPCVDASAVLGTTTTGVSIMIGGDLAGATVKVQPQTSTNYPVDTANSKGECLFTDCAEQWSQCAPPSASLTTIPATPEATILTWDQFAGGSPAATATTNGAGLVGLQLQFECSGSAACSINVQIGTIELTM